MKLSKRMLTRVRRDNKLWGSGCRPPATLTERYVVSASTYQHLKDWIFSTDFLEPLKASKRLNLSHPTVNPDPYPLQASEQATKRGHCFAIREAVEATFARYQKNAKKKGVEPIAKRVYRY